MIVIEMQCHSCKAVFPIPFREWPFEEPSISCKVCGAVMGENQKTAMDGCINYFRLANKAEQSQAVFTFQLRID